MVRQIGASAHDSGPRLPKFCSRPTQALLQDASSNLWRGTPEKAGSPSSFCCRSQFKLSYSQHLLGSQLTKRRKRRANRGADDQVARA